MLLPQVLRCQMMSGATTLVPQASGHLFSVQPMPYIYANQGATRTLQCCDEPAADLLLLLCCLTRFYKLLI
jgi:hypothetical protein